MADQAMSAAAAPAAEGEKPRPSRLRRIIKRTLIALASLVVVLVVLVWLLLANLNSEFVKSRVVALVKDSAGLEIDYDGLEVSLWSGVEARSLVIKGPAKFADHVDEFVRVEGLKVAASLWSMPFGDPEIDSVEISSIEVAVVRDETGATTISELFPPSDKPKAKKPKKPPTPLSQTLQKKIPSLKVGGVQIGSISARYVELEAGQISRDARVGKLAVSGAVHAGGSGLEETELTITSEPALNINLSEASGIRSGQLGLQVNVTGVSADRVDLRVGLELEKQDLIETTGPIANLITLEASAVFASAEKKTTVSLASFEALDKRISVTARAELPDGDSFSAIASGNAAVNLEALPIAIEGLALSALVANVDSERLSWGDGRLSGKASATASLAELSYAGEAQEASIRDFSLTGLGDFDGPTGALNATVGLANAAAKAAGSAVELNAFAANVEGTIRKGSDGQRAHLDGSVVVKSLNAAAPGGVEADASDLNITTTVDGPLASLVTGSIEKLVAGLKFASLRANDGKGTKLNVANTVVTTTTEDLVAREGSMLGVAGAASLALEIASVKGRAANTPVGIRSADLRMVLPLSLAKLNGQLALASAQSRDQSVRNLDLAFDVDGPLSLAPETPGDGRAEVSGAIGAFRSADSRGRLSELRALVSKKGSDDYHLELDATGGSLTVIGKKLPGRLLAKARADGSISNSKIDASATVRGPGGAAVDVALDAGFARRGGTLRYRATLAAEKLEAFAGAIAKAAPSARAVKLADAKLTASASGKLSGLLQAKGRDIPSLTKDPTVTMRGEQTAELELVGLDYRDPKTSLVIPELSVKLASVHRKGGAGRADATITSKSIAAHSGTDRVKVSGLSETLVATFEQPPSRGVVAITSTLTAKSASQSAFPEYRVGNLSLVANAEIDRMRSLFLRKLTMRNPASGTALRASGALEQTGSAAAREGETIPGREALTLDGQLTQSLDPISGWGMAKSAAGSLVVPFSLESGDLLSYRLVAKLMANKVSYVSRDQSIVIDDLNGVIPMAEELALLPSGVVLIPGPKQSPLARTRFFDVNPFLDSDDYITARKITVSGQTLGPLAGNVRFSRSVFSIDQLQVGYRGGQISGQVHAAYREGDPIVRARLNITGVKPSKSKDVLDANAALTFVPRSLSLDGKIQIVRISPDHLRDVLDIIDPYHETVNVNKVRLGLKVGYPKFVRLRLHDGTIDTKVELGGVAKVVRIDEIKAVPLGPIMQIYVAPALAGLLPRQRSQPKAPAERDIQGSDND